MFRIVDGKIHTRGIEEIVIQRMAKELGITVEDLEARILCPKQAVTEGRRQPL